MRIQIRIHKRIHIRIHIRIHTRIHNLEIGTHNQKRISRYFTPSNLKIDNPHRFFAKLRVDNIFLGEIWIVGSHQIVDPELQNSLDIFSASTFLGNSHVLSILKFAFGPTLVTRGSFQLRLAAACPTESFTPVIEQAFRSH